MIYFLWVKIFPLFDPPDPKGSARKKANERNNVIGGGAMMSKIIHCFNWTNDKVRNHRYSGITFKVPFINLSFAPSYYLQFHNMELFFVSSVS
jgi:hypothetical protein